MEAQEKSKLLDLTPEQEAEIEAIFNYLIMISFLNIWLAAIVNPLWTIIASLLTKSGWKELIVP